MRLRPSKRFRGIPQTEAKLHSRSRSMIARSPSTIGFDRLRARSKVQRASRIEIDSVHANDEIPMLHGPPRRTSSFRVDTASEPKNELLIHMSSLRSRAAFLEVMSTIQPVGVRHTVGGARFTSSGKAFFDYPLAHRESCPALRPIQNPSFGECNCSQMVPAVAIRAKGGGLIS